MNTRKIYSRRMGGLDTKVWRFMFILIIGSIVVLGYRITGREDCVPFAVKAESKTHPADSFFYTNENIRFFASGRSANLAWDFNDNSVVSEKGNFVTHAFSREGVYYVSASINAGCEYGKLITVKNKPQSNVSKAALEEIEIPGPSSTIVGMEEEFISPALADSFYEWVVLYHPEMGTRNGEKAKFQFSKGGDYIIQLTLDHNRINNFTKRVKVAEPLKPISALPKGVERLVPIELPKRLPKDDEEENKQVDSAKETTVVKPVGAPAATGPKRLSDKLFKSYLQQVASGEKGMQDFGIYGVQGSTPVVANGNKKIRDFDWLCKELNKRRGLPAFRRDTRVEDVQIDYMNGAITIIHVKFD